MTATYRYSADGVIRIMTENTFQMLIDAFPDTSQSEFIESLHENSMAFKNAALSMTQKAVVSVLGYYNETGYPIIAKELKEM